MRRRYARQYAIAHGLGDLQSARSTQSPCQTTPRMICARQCSLAHRWPKMVRVYIFRGTKIPHSNETPRVSAALYGRQHGQDGYRGSFKLHGAGLHSPSSAPFSVTRDSRVMKPDSFWIRNVSCAPSPGNAAPRPTACSIRSAMCDIEQTTAETVAKMQRRNPIMSSAGPVGTSARPCLGQSYPADCEKIA